MKAVPTLGMLCPGFPISPDIGREDILDRQPGKNHLWALTIWLTFSPFYSAYGTILQFLRRQFANTTLSLAIAFLLMCMALPTTAKLAHAISGHKERSCCNNNRIHIHSGELDCIFQKLKNITHYYPLRISYVLRPPLQVTVLPASEYSFPGRFSPYSFSLRAPPLFS